ncbi:MAG: hypothetical protein OEZ22_11755 [Spirochaetia bacterium]|nr:hypothetical protein [Spirochaetia bacterium]
MKLGLIHVKKEKYVNKLRYVKESFNILRKKIFRLEKELDKMSLILNRIRREMLVRA